MDSLTFLNFASSFNSFLRCAFSAAAAAAITDFDCLRGTLLYNAEANCCVSLVLGAPVLTNFVYKSCGEDDFCAIY
jgi:hypothetical protein